MKPPIYQSLTFWTLLSGLAAFGATFYLPTFPLSEVNILSLVLFVLGLIKIVPAVRAQGIRGALASGIANSLAFWQLLAGLVSFVISYYAPNFPFSYETILGVILFVLASLDIKPELLSIFRKRLALSVAADKTSYTPSAVRCKFRCNNVSKRLDNGGFKADHKFLYNYEFSVVYEGSDENKRFFAYTPTGNLTIGAFRDDLFVPGLEYYLDLTAAA